jgi:hypothetical protein
MNKAFIALTSCIIFAVGCTKDTATDQIVESTIEPSVIKGKCASQEMLELQMQQDPGLAARIQSIELATQNFIKNPENSFLSNGNIVIPVVVNVLYRTAAENVSAAQIQSQIDVLNADFAATNTDYNTTPTQFQSVRSGDTKVRFVLDQVIRKSTTKSSWRTDNAMKVASKGGISPLSPSNKLNMWVCNMSGGILGYAQFPGGSLTTDGVVIDNNAFGKAGSTTAPFNFGRTATHEVGHWLNLRHIWGDATCGNDFVSDTPLHQTSNGGCPTFPRFGSCSSTIPMMTMNYMDYTNDACMYMFSLGQSSRMKATFATGGGRTGFAL